MHIRRGADSRSSVAIGSFFGIVLASGRLCAEVSPVEIHGPTVVEGSAVHFTNERVRIRCVDLGEAQALCTFSATYGLVNMGSSVRAVTLRAQTSGVRPAVFRIGSRYVMQSGADSTVSFVLPSGGSTELEWRGEFVVTQFVFLDLGYAIGHGLSTEANLARHPFLGREEDRREFHPVEYHSVDVPEDRSEVFLEFPRRWSLAAEGAVMQRAGENEQSASLSSRNGVHEFLLYLPDWGLRWGGPFAASMYRFRGSWAVQGGVELRLSHYLFAELALETNFDWYDLVPMVDAATDMLAFLPSLGAGLGLPVRVHPDAEVAVRGQVSATLFPFKPIRFPSLGVAFALDYWRRRESLEPTLFFRIGL